MKNKRLACMVLVVGALLAGGLATPAAAGRTLPDTSQWVQQTIDVPELLNWQRAGRGHVGHYNQRAVQLVEHEDSQGLMLISPQSYGQQVAVSYDVMVMRPATVLVIMLSASEGDGTGELHLPDDHDGGLGDWVGRRTEYFFAFHNAAHLRHPFVVRGGRDSRSELADADRQWMQVGRWHQVQAGRDGDRLWLSIDGQVVLDVQDPDPLDGGHVVLRIRGTGVERASCLITNVRVATPSNP